MFILNANKVLDKCRTPGPSFTKGDLTIGIIYASVSKRVFVQNLSYENEFEVLENELVGGTYFHMNGFTPRLVLTERQWAARKWT